ncbi:hypothetical protein HNP99_000528 [Flavobacterium sp. 28A]|uniref:hypothetical protein n=1 Tax=Flavobacterium sp. 28A TaxID=2735895 RepID=UPI001571582C|nr:hypothetical protein [Flavobacterium sp. 28A]NRT14203.1 hypothetical protein [Flavobacterium sp. 28A]
MKKLFSSKLLLVFSTGLLFTYGLIYACGGDGWYGDWYYGGNSNFAPEAFVDNSYSPLFLSGDVFYGIRFDDQHDSRFNTLITADWEMFLKGSMNAETVKFFLIDNSEKDINDLENYYSSKKENASSSKWSAVFNLNDKKVKAFFRFLYLAKKVEATSVSNRYWSYDVVEVKVFSDWETIAGIEKAYQNSSDDFLKNRYWFQLMKAYFYSDDKQKAIDFFDKTSESVVKNTLYYRALGYCAGVYYGREEYAKSNYLYSKVFDKCPEMRVVTAYSFHPQEEKDWNESLALAKNNQEKAALWAIHGYYKEEFKAIAAIFELDPSSEHLNYLLTRLINNQENKISDNYKDLSVADNNKAKLAQMDKSVLSLVQKIAGSKETNKPYLWNIALGYLQSLNGEYAKADKTYDGVASKLPKTPLAEGQLRILRFVNNLNKITKINSSAEKTILKDLNWIYKELPSHTIENLRFNNALNGSKTYLAALYKGQKNDVMSELFLPTDDFYDNDENLQAMKDFLSKTKKSAIETLAASIYTLKLSDINNFQAVKAAFADDIPEAIAFMEKSDSTQYEVFLGNPFNGNIKDCHDCEHAAYQRRKFTQMEFLKIIKEMEDNVANNIDVYNNSLLLGNAFYNISHFGNARSFYEGPIVGYGSDPSYFREAIKEKILSSVLPKKYYQKAFKAATTKEQKAKCVYLLSKCERNEYYDQMFYSQNMSLWDYYDVGVSSSARNGFKTLQKEYSDTDYYQEVIAECGSFNKFVYQR